MIKSAKNKWISNIGDKRSREPLLLRNPAPCIALPLACSGIGVTYKSLLPPSSAGAATLFLFDFGASTDSWFPPCIASCTRLNSSFLPWHGNGSLNLSADTVLVLVASFAEVIPEPSAPWLLMMFQLLPSVITFALSAFLFRFPGDRRDLRTFPAFLLTESMHVVSVNFLVFAGDRGFVRQIVVESFNFWRTLQLSEEDRKNTTNVTWYWKFKHLWAQQLFFNQMFE